MEFRILGTVEVEHGGVRAKLGPKVRALLGALIAARGRSIPTGTLIDHLSVSDEVIGPATLRSHIAHLRRALNQLRDGIGKLVTKDDVGYALRVAPEQLDADRFRRLYAAGMEALSRRDQEGAVRLLRTGLDLWRGPAYADLTEYPFALSAARELEALRSAAVQARITAELELGRHRDVVDELGRLVAADPANEVLRCQYALATYRIHGAEHAAAICWEGRRLLKEKGIDAPKLENLHRRILLRSPDLDWTPPERPFDVPARSRTFTGRTALLTAMVDVLNESAGELTAIALYGLGGVGKTRLAIEYAHRYADRYNLIYWIPAEPVTGIVPRLAELAGRLGVRQSERREEMVVALWERLRQRSGSWLLIFDDAESPQALASVWPRGGNGHVIVTSRNPGWAGRATPLEVGVLDRQESIRFITNRLTAPVVHVDADVLAGELGDLPLALEQACAFMEETRISVGTYLGLFRRDARRMLGVGEATDSERTVATTWNVSLDRIRDQEPAAVQLLDLCAFLSPLGVPRALLSGQARLLPDPLREIVADEIRYHEVVGMIGRYSLAEVTEVRIGLHPLVQTVVRGTLPADDVREWAGRAVMLVDSAYPGEPDDTAAGVLLPHALAAARHARTVGAEADATVSVLVKASRSASHVGDVQQSVDLLRDALAIVQDQWGPDSTRTADILVRLGYAQRELENRAEARTYFERAVEIRRAEFGADDPSVAEALTGLGMILFDLDLMEQARERLATSLAIREQHPDLDELDLALTYSVFGLVLWSLFDLPAATVALENALEIRQRRSGPEHHSVATSLDNLAKVIFDLGDLVRAREINERALAIREASLGRDHYHVAVSLNHLGFVLRELGELEPALAAHQRALQIFKEQLGLKHTHARGAEPRWDRSRAAGQT